MRRRTLVTLTALTLASAACTTQRTTSTTVTGTPVLQPAPVPVEAAAVNPAGQWTISLVAQGEPMDLAMDLRGVDGVYSGTMSNPMLPPMQFKDAKLDGNRMAISLLVPTGEMAVLNLVFNGDELTGDWSMPGDGGKLTGKRM
ncbi:MAG TPA: hypothetical protein VFM71_04955 [Gemmatimonadaceae bacterium]|nr:hypothetical protein [Gemmatimonadaceae bacterium]